MSQLSRVIAILLLVAAGSGVSGGALPESPIVNATPSARDWAALAKLSDWSGTWAPAPEDRTFPMGRNEPKWLAEVAGQVAELKADDSAGKPRNVYVDCLPERMPSFPLMTVNALEFLFTPGRVMILGEFDGNRLQRIYTDGRGHPMDPESTFNGHSIGYWERATLVVDTVAILPQVYLPLGQAVAFPNNGDMHIEEKIHLNGPDRLIDELVITAPHALAEPWRISRSFTRSRERRFDIIEASCRQGDFYQAKDNRGNATFLPIGHGQGGAPLPPEK